MKNKFIRILSPITLGVIGLLDVAIVTYGIFAIQRLRQSVDKWTIMFAVIEAIALIIGVLVSKEVVSNGVRFDDEKMEFTGLDENNIFEYKAIEKIETSKDTTASLKKNFVDRYSNIIFYLTDGTITTIELGLTTTRTLAKIENEIRLRIKN